LNQWKETEEKDTAIVALGEESATWKRGKLETTKDTNTG